MTSRAEIDLVVVGLGAVGCFALNLATKMGYRAVGIDRYVSPHPHGSTHGETRLIREAYSEGEQYVPLLRRSLELWRQYDTWTAEKIFYETGLQYIGDPNDSHIQGVRGSADVHSIPLTDLTTLSDNSGRIVVPDGWAHISEPHGGYIKVESTLSAVNKLTGASGAAVLFNTEVKACNSVSNGIQLETSVGNVTARKVIFCGGPWARQILPFLEDYLSLERHTLHWFKDSNGLYSSASGFLPFVFHTNSDNYFYGFPTNPNGLVKVSEHAFGERFKDPHEIDRRIHRSDIQHIEELCNKYLPQLDQVVHSTTCMYTMTPDEHFIIDRHPELTNAVYVAGLSGHGYKFAPAIAESLVNMVMDKELHTDLSHFQLSRFSR